MGAVFFYDMGRNARRTHLIPVRLLYGILMIVALYFTYRSWFDISFRSLADLFVRNTTTWKNSSSFAGSFFHTFITAQLAVLWLLTPLSTAGCVVGERERRTLESLLTTSLTDWEIILVLFLSRITNLCSLVVMGLPMLLVIPFLGIVHPGWIITNYFFTATTVLCLGAMGIAVSVGARTSLQGALTGLCLAFVMLPIFLIFIFLDPMLIGVRAYQFLLFGSGLEGVIALLCLRMAVNSLRACSETGVELERLSGLARLSIRPSYGESFTSVHLSAFRDRFCPPVGDAPLLWKDLYRKNLTGTLTGFYLLSSILIGLLALIVTHHISQNVDAQARWNLNDVARYFGVGAIVLGMIPIPIIAAQMVSREHENGTLDPLLTTLLERKEILLSKFKVSVLPTRWVAVLIAGLLFLGMLVGTIHPVAFAALIASLVVYGVLLSCLGLFFSTFFLSTRVATSITLLILLALGCSSFGTFPVSGDNHDGLNWALCIMRDAVSPLATMNMLAFDSNDLQIKRNEIQAAMGALLVVGLAALLLWKLTVIQFGSVGSPSHRLARPQQ